ncbi:hypothetical protein CR513_06513, partial [Mucuna pruriens]
MVFSLEDDYKHALFEGPWMVVEHYLLIQRWCLCFLGNAQGVGKLTSIYLRGQCTRFCVEIDLSKRLVPHIMVRDVKLNLEYEGLHVVCFRCGCYGYKKETCMEYGISGTLYKITKEEITISNARVEVALQLGGTHLECETEQMNDFVMKNLSLMLWLLEPTRRVSTTRKRGAGSATKRGACMQSKFQGNWSSRVGKAKSKLQYRI